MADKVSLQWIGLALASAAAGVVLIAATLTYKSAGSHLADQAPRQVQHITATPRI